MRQNYFLLSTGKKKSWCYDKCTSSQEQSNYYYGEYGDVVQRM